MKFYNEENIDLNEVFSDLRSLSPNDFLIYTVKFKDFVRILEINYEGHINTWYHNLLRTAKEDFGYESPAVTIHYDSTFKKGIVKDLKNFLYGLSKFYYFKQKQLREYRAPIGILTRLWEPVVPKPKIRWKIHPGVIRFKCMHDWDDNNLVRLAITKNHGINHIIDEFDEVCVKKFNIQDESQQQEIIDYLEMKKWKGIGINYSEDGFELCESYADTDEAKEVQNFYLTFTDKGFIINDQVILKWNEPKKAFILL
jgi:hypothetical protein